MKKPRSWQILAANLLWLGASLPGTILFLLATWCPRLAQRRLLRKMLRRARDTQFGRQHAFERLERNLDDYRHVPVSGYASFRPFINDIQGGELGVLTADPVRVLQPTSGTGAEPKLIPFTSGLRRQFQAALAPWLAGLYLLRPRLLLGRQYWCLSPNTRPTANEAGAVPIGFAEDTDYLGVFWQWAARQLLVAPRELAQVTDSAAFIFLTLLVLVKEPNLRLISVWHPSFFTLLLDALPRHGEALATCMRSGVLPSELVIPPELRATFAATLQSDVTRAEQTLRCLAAGPKAPHLLWPRLQVISCWAGPESERWLERLRAAFPEATIQGKGLLATEGVVSIPWGFRGQHVCTVNSHYHEFLEVPGGAAKRCWEVAEGAYYSVVLTTAGGLYRYRLGDRVRIAGFVGNAPLLEFCGREGIVSDICGEKLTIGNAQSAITELEKASGVTFAFAMLAPDRGSEVPRYVLFFQTDGSAVSSSFATWPETLESALACNFHYLHARQIGQLAPVEFFAIRGDAASVYRDYLIREGLRHGDIKFPALRIETTWHDVFDGDWLDTRTAG
jgi:hypothetical protein